MALYAGSGIGSKAGTPAAKSKAAWKTLANYKAPKKAAAPKPPKPPKPLVPYVPTGTGSGSGTGSISTNAKKAKAKTTAVKKPTVATPAATDQQLPTYRDYLADYQAAYQPTINREGQRAASQMASRGLTYSTAGADYEQSVRNALLAEANKQALSVSEQARQADTQAAVDMYGMNLGYEQGMALGFEDKGFTFSPITQRWVNRYLTPSASTTSTANRLISQAQVGDPLEQDIMANAPRTSVTSGATGTREVADVRGGRLLREYQLQKEKNAIEQQLARQSLALEREKLALDRQRFDRDGEAAEAGSDPYTAALGTYYTLAKDNPQANNTVAAEASYRIMTGRDLIEDALAGDKRALDVLRNIRPIAAAQIAAGTYVQSTPAAPEPQSWLQKLTSRPAETVGSAQVNRQALNAVGRFTDTAVGGGGPNFAHGIARSAAPLAMRTGTSLGLKIAEYLRNR